nr:NUDIX domain-containing protein [Actinomadura sp. RB99]
MRCSVRAIILDEEDRVLHCRFAFPEETGEMVAWAAPGGGVEDGETPLAALRRELREEVGLAVGADPPHVWHQEVIGPGYATGHDGVINDYFVVRTASFQPRGSMSDDELAGEHIVGFYWWRLEDIARHRGPEVFAPRDLAALLGALITGGLPDAPVQLGL